MLIRDTIAILSCDHNHIHVLEHGLVDSEGFSHLPLNPITSHCFFRGLSRNYNTQARIAIVLVTMNEYPKQIVGYSAIAPEHLAKICGGQQPCRLGQAIIRASRRAMVMHSVWCVPWRAAH